MMSSVFKTAYLVFKESIRKKIVLLHQFVDIVSLIKTNKDVKKIKIFIHAPKR